MSNWRSDSCETNGITLHYTRTGGGKPPVVLLHGLVANGACWTAVARELENEYDLVMPDARGHGKSSVPDHGYRYVDHAQDVVGLIEALDLSSPILIGHSMGGMVAAVVASRHPKLLRGLVLADPTFLGPQVQREVRDSDVAEQHRRYATMSWDELIAEARTRHPRRSSETIELLARARLQTSLAAFDVLTPPSPDFRQVMREMEVPSLLVIGGPAGVVSQTVATELQSLNSRLQAAQIPAAGHGLPYDRPERFADLVKAFLAQEKS